MLTGENGIINQAMEAKEENAKAELVELVDLTLMEWQTIKAGGEDITLGELLDDKVEDKTFDAVTEEDTNFIIEKNGYEVIVTGEGIREGEATKVGGVRPKLEVTSNYDEETEKVTITVTVTNASDIDEITSIKLFDSSNEEIIAKTTDESTATFEVTENGTYKAVVESITEGIEKNDFLKGQSTKYIADNKEQIQQEIPKKSKSRKRSIKR